MYNFHTERPIWECTFLQIWFLGPLNKTCFFKVSVITFEKAYFVGFDLGLVKNILSRVEYSIFREGVCIKLSGVWKLQQELCCVNVILRPFTDIVLNKIENSFCLMVDHLTVNLKFTSNFYKQDKCKPTFFFMLQNISRNQP